MGRRVHAVVSRRVGGPRTRRLRLNGDLNSIAIYQIGNPPAHIPQFLSGPRYLDLFCHMERSCPRRLALMTEDDRKTRRSHRSP